MADEIKTLGELSTALRKRSNPTALRTMGSYLSALNRNHESIAFVQTEDGRRHLLGLAGAGPKGVNAVGKFLEDRGFELQWERAEPEAERAPARKISEIDARMSVRDFFGCLAAQAEDDKIGAELINLGKSLAELRTIGAVLERHYGFIQDVVARAGLSPAASDIYNKGISAAHQSKIKSMSPGCA